MTADRRLRDLGLSEPLRERFLRPLFAGEFFDHDLRLSSLLLDQAFLMMARGATSLPSEGMGAIAEQLAGRIPGGVRLGARVQRVFDGGVELAGGEPIAAREVVVATEPPEAARLTGAPLPREPRSTTTLWFAAERAPAGVADRARRHGRGPGHDGGGDERGRAVLRARRARTSSARRASACRTKATTPGSSGRACAAARLVRRGRRRLAAAAHGSHALGAARTAARHSGAAAGAGRPGRAGRRRRRRERVDRRRAAGRAARSRGDPRIAQADACASTRRSISAYPGRIGAIWMRLRRPGCATSCGRAACAPSVRP